MAWVGGVSSLEFDVSDLSPPWSIFCLTMEEGIHHPLPLEFTEKEKPENPLRQASGAARRLHELGPGCMDILATSYCSFNWHPASISCNVVLLEERSRGRKHHLGAKMETIYLLSSSERTSGWIARLANFSIRTMTSGENAGLESNRTSSLSSPRLPRVSRGLLHLRGNSFSVRWRCRSG